MGRNEFGVSGHLSVFTFLKHFMMLLKCNFFSVLHFYTLSKTLMATYVALIFFKVETLLNNAFNIKHSTWSDLLRMTLVHIIQAASLI